jgi:hypothetical protein
MPAMPRHEIIQAFKALDKREPIIVPLENGVGQDCNVSRQIDGKQQLALQIGNASRAQVEVEGCKSLIASQPVGSGFLPSASVN